MSTLLSHKHLQDEATAYEWVEAHVWPDGPICPHCGSVEPDRQDGGQSDPLWPLQVLGVPPPVPCHRRHHL